MSRYARPDTTPAWVSRTTPSPEELHDWQAGIMPPVRRLPMRKLAVALLVAHAAVWCAMQVYLTVDYVRSQTQIVEAR